LIATLLLSVAAFAIDDSRSKVMNNSALWRGVLVAVLVIGAATAIGIGSYNAGVAQGIVESGRFAAASPGAVPYPYGWHRPWGGGFFPIFPLLFFFLFFAVMRSWWWGGRGGWRRHHGGVPPAFEEWHRRAHAEPPPSSTKA
jgi:hypothetical protein